MPPSTIPRVAFPSLTARGLVSGTYVDSDHPAVMAFAATHAQGATDAERAVALFYAVRDGFRYDPYRLDLSPQGMKASTVLEVGHGWCVTKAALLAAVCRAAGIPARLGFADVRNHLSTERLRALMGTDVFIWHGYAELWLDGAWRKATPAFNVQLCERFGLHPLDFNGRDDSLYHPFDRQGQRHMEYVAERGAFDDVPRTQIIADLKSFYPAWLEGPSGMRDDDFLADVAREVEQGRDRA
jgi:transglutaminase-like putative cysteine protease